MHCLLRKWPDYAPLTRHMVPRPVPRLEPEVGNCVGNCPIWSVGRNDKAEPPVISAMDPDILMAVQSKDRTRIKLSLWSFASWRALRSSFF